MCRDQTTLKYSDVSDAETLARWLFIYYHIDVSAETLEKMIRQGWDTLSKLAHAIHKEQNSSEAKLNRAVENVAALSAEGIQNVVAGRASADLDKDFLLIADRIRKRSMT